MSTVSWVGGSINSTPGNTTVYLGLFNAGEPGTTDAQSRLLSAAGTYSKMAIQVTANGGNTATLRFRSNGSNGNQVVSVGSGATGWFQDTTNTDTVSDGDLINLSLATGSGITYKGVYGCLFTVSGSGAITYPGQGGEMMGTNFSTGNQDKFMGGIATLTASSETDTQLLTRAAGTYSKLSLYANTSGQCPHFRLRINAADGTLDIAEGLGANLQTDSTHSDAVVSGDTVSFRMSTTGTSRWSQASVRFTSSNSKFDVISGGGSSNIGSGTHYIALFGTNYAAGETVEANAQAKSPAAFVATKFRLRVGTNALSGGSQVFTLRINGADGTNTVTVPVTTTGTFEDTTHTDNIAAGDLVNIKIVGSNSSGSSQFTVGTLLDGATASTITSNTTTTLTGVSQALLANLVQTAGITTTLTGISQQILATRTINSTIVTTLQGIGQTLLAQAVRGPGLGRRQFWTS